MQGVVREGTGQALKNMLPAELAVAGKTGTTDEQRDAWFAGFTGDRVAVVWVGYDDNRPAKLSGSAAALPVWGEMMASLDPEPLELPRPDGIELVSIDPQSGLRGSGCAGAVEVPFMKGSAPAALAPCASATAEVIEKAVAPVKSWLERIFGK
jgi:penicillin-binding protein 1B